ncbi:MAG: hypothetical protein CSA34_01420 [Desulfobulbus propionicus]|nr:MAG: hypothetical protein CSA34_01420 [Desulfobulbus propionicus]
MIQKNSPGDYPGQDNSNSPPMNRATTSTIPCFFSHPAQVWWILLFALFTRLLLAPHFLLVPDEANYWQWSRHLALGYHDHPPMIAWLIRLSTMALGQTELAVRLPTILGITAASVYMALLTARFSNWTDARALALASQLPLMINGSALIATPDGLLLPCWAAACYHAIVAVEQGSRRHWLMTGLWFGLGMLSKYTMLLFLPGLFFFLLFSKTSRQELLHPWPWLGLLLSIIVFSPVLIWNANNEWTTFRHVLYQGGMGSTTTLTLRFLGDYLLVQILLISPVFAGLLVRTWLRPIKTSPLERDRFRYLQWNSLFVFILFLILSFHVRIYGNWPAPAYCTALILIAIHRDDIPTSGSSRLWRIGIGTAFFITLPVILQLLYPVLPLPIKLDRVARETCGWKTLATHVHQELQEMESPSKTFVFGLRYQTASELAFYMPGQKETVSMNRWTRPNVYDFWFNDQDVLGKDAVGIYIWKGMEKRLAPLFERSAPVKTIHLYRHSPWFGKQLIQTYYLFRGYGFKGGLRWQPQVENDIRNTRHQREN